ncbi:hypothetical protein NPIL_325831, partial [Nephila pilipes]
DEDKMPMKCLVEICYKASVTLIGVDWLHLNSTVTLFLRKSFKRTMQSNGWSNEVELGGWNTIFTLGWLRCCG